jgi:hypothetical protein
MTYVCTCTPKQQRPLSAGPTRPTTSLSGPIPMNFVSETQGIFFVCMPFWLIYMETYGIDFLTPLFVIYISKHHHHHKGSLIETKPAPETAGTVNEKQATSSGSRPTTSDGPPVTAGPAKGPTGPKERPVYIYAYIYIYAYLNIYIFYICIYIYIYRRRRYLDPR